ncbi:MAG: tetratricopeptide repeat protein [Pedobacter sp.]|nr:MAG: tetratricopeptide repeat protein [Pedobacter sp.]
MKKIILTLLLPILWNLSFAQNKTEAEKLVDEGITLHDKGEYEKAIEKYNLALAADKDNLFAYAEIAYSLFAQKKYDEAIATSEKAFKIHKTGDELKTLYVTYGNSLDMVDRAIESINAYDKGIKLFPDYQMFYYNKAVTLNGLKRNDEAMQSLQQALKLNPNHPGSHNLASNILKYQNNTIGALLSSFRFLMVEPTGERAQSVLEKIKGLLTANVTKEGAKNVNINLPSGGDKNKLNNFSTVFLMLSMASALDYSDEYKSETDVQRTMRKFNSICDALSVSKKDNNGFLWDYYVPYFIELKQKGYSEIFSNVVFASQQSPEISQYFKDNKTKLEEFANWSESYKWKQN